MREGSNSNLIKNKVNMNNKNHMSWLTRSLKNACNNKKYLYIKLLKNINCQNKQNYKKYKSKLEHIGLVVRMSILDTKGRWLKPQHQYVFSVSKRHYLHCFCRLSCEIIMVIFKCYFFGELTAPS